MLIILFFLRRKWIRRLIQYLRHDNGVRCWSYSSAVSIALQFFAQRISGNFASDFYEVSIPIIFRLLFQ